MKEEREKPRPIWSRRPGAWEAPDDATHRRGTPAVLSEGDIEAVVDATVARGSAKTIWTQRVGDRAEDIQSKASGEIDFPNQRGRLRTFLSRRLLGTGDEGLEEAGELVLVIGDLYVRDDQESPWIRRGGIVAFLGLPEGAPNSSARDALAWLGRTSGPLKLDGEVQVGGQHATRYAAEVPAGRDGTLLAAYIDDHNLLARIDFLPDFSGPPTPGARNEIEFSDFGTEVTDVTSPVHFETPSG